MAELQRDHSLWPVSQIHTYSTIEVEADANEIYAGAHVQLTADGYAVIVGDTGGLGVGPVVGVNDQNVPDQAGKAAGTAQCNVYQGLYKRPIAAVNPVTDADMLKTVYAANNFDVTNDSSKPVLGTLAGINNDAGTCTVLISGAANATASSGLTLIAERTITGGELSVAGVGPEHFDIGSPVPDTAVIAFARSNLDDAFDNGSGVSLTMTVGHDGDRSAYDTGFDCFTGSVFEGAGWARGAIGAGSLASTVDGTSTGQLSASFTAGADQLANFTDGSVTVQIWGYLLP
jgi:hypothetical protein